FQREPQRDGPRDVLTTAHPILPTVGESSVLCERLPNRAAVTLRIEAGLVGDLHTRGFERRDDELAVPLVLDGAVTVAVKDDALHGAIGALRFTHKTVAVPIAHTAGEVAVEISEPPQHVGPGKQH